MLPFWGCERKPQEPKIHQIRFGDIVRNPSENKDNRGFRFQHFLHIDLNTDSLLLKQNHAVVQKPQKGKTLPKYFKGKIPEGIRIKIADFEQYVLDKESGSKLKIADQTVLYHGPITYLEYKKDTIIRYFYLNHLKSAPLYDQKLGNFSEALYEFAVNPQFLQRSQMDLNDDSLISPIVTRKDFIENVPPFPVQKTIKFIPPVK